MATILRWFDVDGERHRAYFRQTQTGRRELVLGGRDWQASVGDVRASTLEELRDQELTELVATACSRSQHKA
jgi:hypothetical protein